MSFDWSSEPLTIQSIVKKFTLPVVIRSAPGFRGSSRPVILHSILHSTFGYGRALKVSQSSSSQHPSYRPIDSEIVAVPAKYPGYFECLPSSDSQKQVGVVPETSIHPIVERMQASHRSEAFYVASPIRVYTVETNEEGVTCRVWHQIEAHQIILFDQLVDVEYTPTMDDELTDEDYAFSWWFCFGKQVLNRNESALKCISTQHQVCYVPCSSTDELNLIPVGQRGSSNVNKLQSIHNLIEQFPLPINIKLANLPNSYVYTDFVGSLQLRGTRSEEFAVCASLSSSNIFAISTSTPLKFVVASLPPRPTSQIRDILASCQIFVNSFDMQIRRIIMKSHPDNSAHRSRTRYPKNVTTNDDRAKRSKRSNSVDQQAMTKDDQNVTTTTADEGYRSSSSAARRRHNYRQQRAISADPTNNNAEQSPRKQTLSTDDDSTYNSLVHLVRAKKETSPTSSSSPPALPKKPPNFPYPQAPISHERGQNPIGEIDSPNANGAILMDATNELFLALPSDTRFT
ncbi:unnamed protein product [Adineta ricciae]|uniref:CABIT domain-containing protein n=1 Tax=Adineta ricciae TaxID=249248 RepID=A0A814CYF4_ADIRI|nr:unnamed protein product [Adineta ricciae]CAF1267978.1 unnamed protein product [Adineta ricciae]